MLTEVRSEPLLVVQKCQALVLTGMKLERRAVLSDGGHAVNVRGHPPGVVAVPTQYVRQRKVHLIPGEIPLFTLRYCKPSGPKNILICKNIVLLAP